MGKRGVEPDRLRLLRDGTVELAPVVVHDPANAIGIGELRVEPNRLVEVGKGPAGVVVRPVGDAAIEVGRCKAIALRARQIDHARARSDPLVPDSLPAYLRVVGDRRRRRQQDRERVQKDQNGQHRRPHPPSDFSALRGYHGSGGRSEPRWTCFGPAR